jgi:hypothetical protein
MEIEIRDELGGIKVKDTLSNYEGTISDNTGKQVFYMTGDRYNIILQFMNEEELDRLIDALNYFKEHKEV